MNYLNIIRSIFKYQPFEKFLYCFVENAKVDELKYKLVPMPHLYKSSDFRLVTRNGVKLKLWINDLVDWFTFWGFYDASISFLLQHIDEGFTIIDIGTNKGIVALNMGKKAGKKGRVIGFEPNKIAYNCCLENIQLNNFGNIEILNNALGDKKEQLFLSEPDLNNSGGNFVTTTQNSNTVDVLVLDSVVESKSLPKIDLIKIDVEGFELNVLKGGFNTIEKYKPALFVELVNSNLLRNQTSAKELVELLIKLGYRVTNSISGHAINGDTDFSEASYDIYCQPIK
ncbi:MAG: FkbM family methyltransferase [Mucilaginibacter sp.]